MTLLKRISHDHTALERHALQIRKALAVLASGQDGDAAEHLTTARKDLDKLERALEAHFKEEEAQLFPYARRMLGEDLPEVDRLIEEHRGMERDFAEVQRHAGAASAEDNAALAEAYGRFFARLEAHSLDEANFLSVSWNMLFPEEILTG